MGRRCLADMTLWLSEFYACLWVFSQVSLSAATGGESKGRPNIVLILADDLGWNDIGYHNPDIKTPKIDRLAAQGIKLNQSYTQSICTPTRSALMTGRYPFKTGMQHGVLHSTDNACLPTRHQLLSEDLRHHGYSTHLVGKWHLGFCKWACTPTYRGFDTFFGYYSGAHDYYSKKCESDNTMHPYLDLRDDIHPAWTHNNSYSTQMFTDRAIDVINQHNTSTPLFLLLSLQNPHFPLEVPEKYTEMYPDVVNEGRRTYCGMVSALDEGVGNVTTALEERGMMDNTLILFLSDNGPDVRFHGNSYPLRGAKLSVWEGGHRSVSFLHGAGLQKTGVTYDGLVHVVDWRPTLVAAAGGEGVPGEAEADIDGMNLWENIRTGSPSPRTEFVYNLDDVQDDFFNVGNAALRDGDYKLILGYTGSYNDWYKPQNTTEDEPLHMGIYIAGDHPEQLYNLREDPTERRNIALQEPDMVAKLKLKINQYRKMMVPAQTRQCSPSAEPLLHGGVWSPGWC